MQLSKETSLFQKDKIKDDLQELQTDINGANKSTVAIYYRSSIQRSNPDVIKPTTSTSIGTSPTTDNAWQYVMPYPKKGYFFYTCEQYTAVDGTKSYSTVRELNNDTYISKWVSSNDASYIDGGSIYAHSVTANQMAANSITIGNMDAEAKSSAMNSKVYPIGVNNGSTGWHFLGTLTLAGQTDEADIEVHTGSGQNNNAKQNLTLHVNIKRGYNPTTSATAGITVRYEGDPTLVDSGESLCSIVVRCTSVGVMNVYLYTPSWGYADGWYQVKGRGWTWVHKGTLVTTAPSEGTQQSVTVMNPYTTATSYITKVTEQGIKIHPSGTEADRIQLDSEGMDIYKGNVSVAKYGDEARVGKVANNYARTLINTGGMKVIQRKSDGTDIELANIGYGDGTTSSGGTAKAPYYTFGIREGTPGNYSVSEGYENTASGFGSHAGGDLSKATNTIAFAHGEGTIAARMAQTVIGLWNIEDDKSYSGYKPHDNPDFGHYAFIIGNGNADNDRNNAFMVDWEGGIYPFGRAKMTDFVVEEGTSGIWTYRKWHSGIAECWGTWTGSLTHYATFGGFYGYNTAVNFPTSLFKARPTVNVNAQVSNGFAWAGALLNVSATGAGLYALAQVSGTQTCTFDIHAIGRWFS